MECKSNLIMYMVTALIKALMFLKPLLLNNGSLPLDDLVGLAWKHRMKHAKLGTKQANRLSRGRNRQACTVCGQPGWSRCIMGAVIVAENGWMDG